VYASAIFKTICVDFAVASTKLVRTSKAKLTKWMAMLLLNWQPMHNEKTCKIYIFVAPWEATINFVAYDQVSKS
jgi:hypothetical protein